VVLESPWWVDAFLALLSGRPVIVGGGGGGGGGMREWRHGQFPEGPVHLIFVFHGQFTFLSCKDKNDSAQKSPLFLQLISTIFSGVPASIFAGGGAEVTSL